MILSVHLLAGAAIAEKIQNPALGLFLAFLSHYILDLIPHREYRIWKISDRQWKNSFKDFLKVFFDIFAGFFLLAIISKNYLPAALGGFLAMLPDGLIFLFLLFPKIKILEALRQFHQKTHWFRDGALKKETPVFYEILSQVLVVAASVILFLR